MYYNDTDLTFHYSIAEHLKKDKIHGSASYSKLIKKIRAEDRCEEISDVALKIIKRIAYDLPTLASASRKIAERVYQKMDMWDNISDRTIIRTGMFFLDLMHREGLIVVKKHAVFGKKPPNFIEPTPEFIGVCYHARREPSEIPMNQGPFTWEDPVMSLPNGGKIDIVKRARSLQILDWYKPEGNEEWYAALNRQNHQGYAINKEILKIANEGSHPYLDPKVSFMEKLDAVKQINRIDAKKVSVQEFRIKRNMEWMLENIDGISMEDAERISIKRGLQQADDWHMEKTLPYKKILSAWSKRDAQDIIISKANHLVDGTIHYLHQMDSRGRMYSMETYLTPMGKDIAKALLMFDKPTQVDFDHFRWNLANHAGHDKMSFEGRIRWVEDNHEKIYEIGSGGWNDLAKEVSNEKKSKWQFLAFCIEYKQISDFITLNGNVNGFKTQLMSSSDGTNQGLQILSMIGADHKVGPYVNIMANDDGSVGDIYAKIGRDLSENLRKANVETEGISGLLKAFPTGHKAWRKIAKRSVMTAAYAATRYGMGCQIFEDKDDHGYPETEALRMQDCRILGDMIFSTCQEEIKGGYDLMEWMQEGARKWEGGATISWTLPDGFKAFSAKPKMKRTNVIGTIGGVMYQPRIYTITDEPNIKDHISSCSPQIIHSLDGFILRTIVNRMPKEANVSTIHDCFSTDFIYTEDLRLKAMFAYGRAACRTRYQEMMTEAFGVARELPKGGDWTIQDLVSAHYLVS